MATKSLKARQRRPRAARKPKPLGRPLRGKTRAKRRKRRAEPVRVPHRITDPVGAIML